MPNKKIKRYSNLYGGKKKSEKKVLYQIGGSVLILLVVVGLVYVISTAIHNSLENNKEVLSNEVTSQTDAPSEDKKEPQQEKIIAEKMTTAILKSNQKLNSFLTKAKNDGATSVIIPIKTSDGYLNYSSSIPEATTWKTIDKNPVDLKAVIATIKEQGLTPIAQVYAFKDNIAPHANRNNTYINGLDMKSTKLFKTGKSNNSLRYLNPYKEVARKYICDVIKEIKELGLKQILLEGAEFPVESFDKATITGVENLNKNDIMKIFVKELNETNVDYILSFDISAINSQTSNNIYGGDPSTYGSKSISPIINTTDKTKISILSNLKDKSDQLIIIPQIPKSENNDTIINDLASLLIDSYVIQ